MVRSAQTQLMVTGLEMLPATVIAIYDQALGAALIVVVLAAAVVRTWMVVRATQQRHRETLSFAQNATNMGGDPTPVIAALLGEHRQNGAPAELPAHQYDLRGYQQVRSMADTWPYRPPRV